MGGWTSARPRRREGEALVRETRVVGADVRFRGPKGPGVQRFEAARNRRASFDWTSVKWCWRRRTGAKTPSAVCKLSGRLTRERGGVLCSCTCKNKRVGRIPVFVLFCFVCFVCLRAFTFLIL